ncbi:hypothetical protein OG427_07285 [Streptomyces sp. NBC_00133]|uniref:hypothetical protein n=1 Tax=Streptomyces sp. NBC_00133 TaxID=2903624 RepID=UPI00324ADBCF
MTTPPPNEIHQLRLKQLAIFIRESEQVLADWDAYSDEHTDLDGWPHDDHAYGLRASRRDADTWRSFNRVRSFAKNLLATAEVQLQRLPARHIQNRWAWQLATLDTALDRLSALQSDWLTVRDSLSPSAKPGTEEYDAALAERNAEVWHYLDEWASHGQAVLDIHTATQHNPPPLPAIAPVRAPASPAQATKPTTARR